MSEPHDCDWAAVPDPTAPDRIVFFAIGTKGELRDYPIGAARWRPLPPAGSSREERAAFYAPGGPYRRWVAAVQAAIQADRGAARRAFLARYPEPSMTPPPQRPAPTPVSRRKRRWAVQLAQSLLAHQLRAAGATHAAIAHALGVSEPTARRRVAEGAAQARAAARVEHGGTVAESPADPLAEAVVRLLGQYPGRGRPIPEHLQRTVGELLGRRG
jgi:hypothetical protein